MIDDQTLADADIAIINSIQSGESTAANVPNIANDEATYGERDFNLLANFNIYEWLKGNGF